MPSHVVIAPLDAEQEGSGQGLAELRSTLAQLAELRSGRDQPRLEVVVTRCDKRRMMARAVLDAVHELGVEPSIFVPTKASVQKAAALRVPIVASHPDGGPGRAYRQLAEHLQERVA